MNSKDFLYFKLHSLNKCYLWFFFTETGLCVTLCLLLIVSDVIVRCQKAIRGRGCQCGNNKRERPRVWRRYGKSSVSSKITLIFFFRCVFKDGIIWLNTAVNLGMWDLNYPHENTPTHVISNNYYTDSTTSSYTNINPDLVQSPLSPALTHWLLSHSWHLRTVLPTLHRGRPTWECRMWVTAQLPCVCKSLCSCVCQ